MALQLGLFARTLQTKVRRFESDPFSDDFDLALSTSPNYEVYTRDPALHIAVWILFIFWVGIFLVSDPVSPCLTKRTRLTRREREV